MHISVTCADAPCQNGAQCVTYDPRVWAPGFACHCGPGWSGTYCAVPAAGRAPSAQVPGGGPAASSDLWDAVMGPNNGNGNASSSAAGANLWDSVLASGGTNAGFAPDSTAAETDESATSGSEPTEPESNSAVAEDPVPPSAPARKKREIQTLNLQPRHNAIIGPQRIIMSDFYMDVEQRKAMASNLAGTFLALRVLMHLLNLNKLRMDHEQNRGL